MKPAHETGSVVILVGGIEDDLSEDGVENAGVLGDRKWKMEQRPLRDLDPHLTSGHETFGIPLHGVAQIDRQAEPAGAIAYPFFSER